jgi:hypothetical protein
LTIFKIPTLAGATGDRLIAHIVIVWLWVLGDDIPGVDETGEEAE